MSWYDGVPAALLYSGPPANYTAAAAASTSAQNLMTGASTNYTQPNIPFGFLQQGKIGQAIVINMVGILSATTATTAIITVGLVNAAGSISGTSLIATPALTVSSFSSQPWDLSLITNVRAVGWGTSSVSTQFMTTGDIDINTATAGTVLRGVCTPTLTSTIDASVTQWMYATVTYNTSSTTNSCTLEQVLVYGMT